VAAVTALGVANTMAHVEVIDDDTLESRDRFCECGGILWP
jgi:hypothetical protein